MAMKIRDWQNFNFDDVKVQASMEPKRFLAIDHPFPMLKYNTT